MTGELLREDASLLQCEATVLAIDEAGIVLGRQPGFSPPTAVPSGRAAARRTARVSTVVRA